MFRDGATSDTNLYVDGTSDVKTDETVGHSIETAAHSKPTAPDASLNDSFEIVQSSGGKTRSLSSRLSSFLSLTKRSGDKS